MKIDRRRTRIAARFALAAAVFLAFGYLTISWVTAERLTRPTNHPVWFDPHLLSPDARPWTTRTQDGFTLRGWRLAAEGNRRLVVLVHGMWSSWPEMASLGRDLHERGFDVLLFDLRGHGESDPSRLSLGSRERADVRAVMKWALESGYDEESVGWLGYSMGGATVILEAAQNPSIHAAVIDSAYGDMPRLLESQLSKHSRLPSWFNPGILACARLVYGLKIEDLVPISAAASWGDRPMLLIHGDSDTTVPVDQARSLGRAVGSACVTTILHGVEHVQGYNADPDGYVEMISEFFEKSFQP